ncbi:hypothetical protein PMI07_006389 [Rhizobium sp. CF080]|nr:hypothetical protein PMI07_006389 [Rhizobium sp. CF080]
MAKSRIFIRTKISCLALTALAAVTTSAAQADTAKLAFQYIELSNITTHMDSYSWDILKNKFNVYKHPNSSGAYIQPVRSEGKALYTFSYGGPFGRGCKVNGRWSSISPLFDIGKKTSDRISCSDPSKPGETNKITMSTSSSFKDGILTLSSILRDEQRQPFEWMGKHSTIGTDYEVRVDIAIQIQGTTCKLIKADLREHGKNIHDKSFEQTKTLSFQPGCSLR